MKLLIILAAFVCLAYADSDTDGKCSSSPCQNGAVCKNIRFLKNYYCVCKLGFYGKDCEKKVKRRCDFDFDEDLCQNGGECVSQTFFRYYCKCRPGYTGKNCKHTPCDSDPCMNGGTCDNLAGDEGGYACRCPEGFWEGDHCEIEMPPATHNCEDRNPCTQENAKNNDFYFAHDLKTKFVQCSEWGQCYEMPCGPGTEWDQDKLTCGWPK